MELLLILALIVSILALIVYFAVRSSNKEDEQFKKIIAEVPGFDANDSFRNEKRGLAIDSANGSILVAGVGFSHVYTGKEILACEVTADSVSITRTKRGSQLASAAVGGLVFGKTGATVGGLTGKTVTESRTSKVELIISLDDPQRPIWRMEMLLLRPLERAQELHSLISSIIKKSDASQPHILETPPSTPEPPTAPISGASEIERLVSLRDSGEITPEEFAILKARHLAS